MNECRRVENWLEESAWRALAPEEQRRVDAHAGACPRCRQLQRLLQATATEMAGRAVEAEREALQVDWGALNERILRRAHAAPRPLRLPVRPWLRPAFAAAALLLAAGGAWLWFAPHPAPPPALAAHLSAPALQRIEAEVSRGDARAYLANSRMLLSGVLESCRERPLEAWEAEMYSRQARALLLRQRYLARDSEATPAGRRVADLNERLSWLLTEIATLQPGTPCRRLQEIRDLAGRENLLLKLRLLEGEMAPGAVEEV